VVALQSKPITKTREIVAVCRRSGQRRSELRAVIVKGNDTSSWPSANGKVPVLQLLRDCETRWSSTFNMIDRLMEIYPVRVAPFTCVVLITVSSANPTLLVTAITL
jgi:hypothetical protein